MATTPKKTPIKKATAPQAASKLAVATFDGKEVDTLPVPTYMTATPSPTLIAQVIRTSVARNRIRRAHTKGRSEVRGGGRKPWKQKGTGRARHGSRRSPIWVGGGITFGPRSRPTSVATIPTKLRRRALSGALSARVRDGKVVVVRFEKDIPVKTKEVAAAIGDNAHGLLLVMDPERVNALNQSARNIPGLTIRSVVNVTVFDVARATTIWIDEASLPVLEARCATPAKK